MPLFFRLFAFVIALGIFFVAGIRILEGEQMEEQRILPEDMYVFSRVVDGDTIEVRKEKEAFRVRLIGLDAPEVHTRQDCWGEESTTKAKEFFEGATQVKLTFDGERKDEYGRLLAYVSANWRDFGAHMIKNGFAREYTFKGREYAKQKEYKSLAAKAERKGWALWGACN